MDERSTGVTLQYIEVRYSYLVLISLGTDHYCINFLILKICLIYYYTEKRILSTPTVNNILK